MLTAVFGLLAAHVRSAPAVSHSTGGWVEAWVDLSEPLPAASAGAEAGARQAQRVAEQQERVGRELAALGAIELTRLRHTRNAIGVRLTPAMRTPVLAIPGVVRLRTMQALHPPRTTTGPPF